MSQRRSHRQGEFPPAPEPLSVPVPDSHTHLDLVLEEAMERGSGPETVAAAVATAKAVGVDRLVQVGVDVPTSRWAVAAAHGHAPIVATVAVHPNEAPRLSDLDAALAEIDALAADPRVRGVGETGLDTFRTGPDGRTAQEKSFRGHIEIAKRHSKLHTRHRITRSGNMQAMQQAWPDAQQLAPARAYDLSAR
jgi:TatD DNase family protein